MFLDTGFLKSDELWLRLEKTVEGDPAKSWVPAYHFSICDLQGEQMGSCDLRVGYSQKLYYGGNIGYHIEEGYRGRHYAGKACLLLFELAKKHGMDHLIITCDPDNIPSRRTCEYAGGTLLEIAEIPEDHEMRAERGKTKTCIYRFVLKERSLDQ